MGIAHVNVVLIGRLRWAWWFAICVRPSGRVAQPANGVQQPTNTRGPLPPRLNIYFCVACGAITAALHYRDAGICGRGQQAPTYTRQKLNRLGCVDTVKRTYKALPVWHIPVHYPTRQYHRNAVQRSEWPGKGCWVAKFRATRAWPLEWTSPEPLEVVIWKKQR